MLSNRIIPFLVIAIFSTSSTAMNGGQKRRVDKYAKLRNALPYLRKEMSQILAIRGQTVPSSRAPDVLLELLEKVDQIDSEALDDHYLQSGDGILTIERLAQSPVLMLGQTHTNLKNLLLNYALTLRLSPGSLVLMEAFEPDENFTLLPIILAHLLFAEHFANSNLDFRDPQSGLIRDLYRAASVLLLELCSRRNIHIPYIHVVAQGWDLDSENDVERNDQLTRLITTHSGGRIVINCGHAHVPLYTMRMTKGSLSGYLDSTLEMMQRVALSSRLPIEALLETASVARLQASLPSGSLELIFESDLNERTREFEEARCSVCPNLGINQCGRCKEARYCSGDCQKKHWPEHKKTCGKK